MRTLLDAPRFTLFGRPRVRRLPGGVFALFLLTALPVFPSPMNGNTQAQTTTYCQLLKTPAAFNRKLIRITGVYLYTFETQRLLPSSCCEDRDPKTWVEFGDLDARSRKLAHRFPQGTGMVLGTFLGRVEYSGSPNFHGSQLKFTITTVEKVEHVAAGGHIGKAGWAPPLCKQ
jgi:hypothetical protein